MEFGGGTGDWYSSAPTELMNYYVNGEPTEKLREVIVLIKVLADEINTGYYNTTNVVISEVNGKRITNMRDLVNAFERYDGQYHVIEDVRGYKITLGKKNVDENSKRILERYKIKSDRSEDLK